MGIVGQSVTSEFYNPQRSNPQVSVMTVHVIWSITFFLNQSSGVGRVKGLRSSTLLRSQIERHGLKEGDYRVT